MPKRNRAIYRLEIECEGAVLTPAIWRVGSHGDTPGHGRPTTENLARWVKTLEATRCPVFKRLGLHRVIRARIVRQTSGKVVAEWRRTERRSFPLGPFFGGEGVSSR
jgi:hypothetical protein